jgi:hypothetical protein
MPVLDFLNCFSLDMFKFLIIIILFSLKLSQKMKKDPYINFNKNLYKGLFSFYSFFIFESS